LPAGSCRLVAWLKDYHQVGPLKRTDVPSGDIAIKMTQTGNVHGKVTQAGGAPTDGPYLAEIKPEGGEKIGSWGGSTTVKADGTFEFDGVPPGRYVVTARQNPGPVVKGKDPNAKTVDVTPGKTLDVEISVK
jgi:hypothetical protein